jgi:hypothetical protein
MTTRPPRVLRLVAAALLAAVVLLLAVPAAHADPPAPPTVESPGAFPFGGELSFAGTKAEDTQLVLAVDGEEQTCSWDHPRPGSGTSWRCTLPYALPAPGTHTVAVTQVLEDEVSDAATATFTVTPNRFAPGAPEATTDSDAIVIRGTRDPAPDVDVIWTLQGPDGTYLVSDGEPSRFGPIPGRACETEGSDRFVCRHEPAAARMSGAAVTAAAVPGGTYTAQVQQVLGGDVALGDPVTLTFEVTDAAPVAPEPEPDPDPGPDADPDTASSDAPATSADPADTAEPADDPVPAPSGPTPDPAPAVADDPTPATEESPSTAPEALPDEETVALEDLQTEPPPTASVDASEVLALGIAAFTLAAVAGARGLGRAGLVLGASASATSGGPHRTSAPPTSSAGTTAAAVAVGAAATAAGGGALNEELGDEVRAHRPFGDAWGDRSATWRFPGWSRTDALSVAAPWWLASRLPLVSRIGADAAYLRAALGSLWLALPAAGLVLGILAAVDTGGVPLPPTLALTTTLLVLAVLDAAAGLAAVVAFATVVLARGGLAAQGLEPADGLRGLLVLAALWFVIPLVGSAARPFRRSATPGHDYRWDRLGDVAIAALLGGWAVHTLVGALGDLTGGRDTTIGAHAGLLALVAMSAVAARFVLEELVARGYPRRLESVALAGEVPDVSWGHDVRGILVRVGLMALLAAGFLGLCWQLWAGLALFALPQVIALVAHRLPRSPALEAIVPRGIVEVLVLLVAGLALAAWVDNRVGGDVLDAARLGFVVLALPAALLGLLAEIGGDADEDRWTWPRQLAGAAVLVASAALVVVTL